MRKALLSVLAWAIFFVVWVTTVWYVYNQMSHKISDLKAYADKVDDAQLTNFYRNQDDIEKLKSRIQELEEKLDR